MSDTQEQWLEDIIRLTEADDQKKTAKQLRILEAAIEIFSEKGFAAASTSEIAQKAGVAEGTIFRHYKTKKELLLSIAGPIAAKVVAPFLIRDFAKVLDMPYERIDDFLRAVAKDRLAFARKNVKLIRILVHELPFQPELLEQVKGVMSTIVYVRLEKIIRHFQERGQLIEAPPWRMIRSSISMLIGMIFTHVILFPEYPIDEDEEIDRTVELLLYGIAGRA
jgi:AcrR family transcriptional regulator